MRLNNAEIRFILYVTLKKHVPLLIYMYCTYSTFIFNFIFSITYLYTYVQTCTYVVYANMRVHETRKYSLAYLKIANLNLYIWYIKIIGGRSNLWNIIRQWQIGSKRWSYLRKVHRRYTQQYKVTTARIGKATNIYICI